MFRVATKRIVQKILLIVSIFLLSNSVISQPIYLGEHKLCDGLELKQREEPRFHVIYHEGKSQIEISGFFDIGLTDAVEAELNIHPDVSGVILDSEGGNIYQGRGVAKLIRVHQLDTYVYSNCYSACSIAFIAGKNRYLDSDGKLGFHGYRLESAFAHPNVDIEAEQDLDFEFFSKFIDDPEFLSKIFSADCQSIWTPTHEELRAANIIR